MLPTPGREEKERERRVERKICPPPPPPPSSHPPARSNHEDRLESVRGSDSTNPILSCRVRRERVCGCITSLPGNHGQEVGRKIISPKTGYTGTIYMEKGLSSWRTSFSGEKQGEEKKLFESRNRFVGVWPRSNARWIQLKFFFLFSMHFCFHKIP